MGCNQPQTKPILRPAVKKDAERPYFVTLSTLLLGLSIITPAGKPAREQDPRSCSLKGRRFKIAVGRLDAAFNSGFTERERAPVRFAMANAFQWSKLQR